MHDKRIRLGMVGGGQGAFIGPVHRVAALMEGHFELVAGALSANPEKAAASGRELDLAPDRTYGSFADMARREARLKHGIEAVAIVTPNHLHLGPAREFLKRGIHVICDKPLCTSLAEARKFVDVVEKSGAVFVLTHTYAGYPMVRHARAMVEAGDLGEIRIVQVEYPQDWLAEKIEDSGHKQAEWRMDPTRSGIAGCLADIGTHAYHLVRFVSGLKTEGVCADLARFVPGRQLDDNAHVLLRFEGGAKGMLWASQIATGQQNGLRLRLFGTKGSIEWAQEDPNDLWFSPYLQSKRRITRGGPECGTAASRMSRFPSGHPEGYLEAFANIYAEAAEAIRAARSGIAPAPDVLYPTIYDGLEGMAFVDACVRSDSGGGRWMALRS